MFSAKDHMRVPEPRRKGGKFLRAVLWLSLLLLIAAGGAFYGKLQYEAEGPLAADQPFTVERGMNARAVAKKLEEQGIIRSAEVRLPLSEISKESAQKLTQVLAALDR